MRPYENRAAIVRSHFSLFCDETCACGVGLEWFGTYAKGLVPAYFLSAVSDEVKPISRSRFSDTILVSCWRNPCYHKIDYFRKKWCHHGIR